MGVDFRPRGVHFDGHNNTISDGGKHIYFTPGPFTNDTKSLKMSFTFLMTKLACVGVLCLLKTPPATISTPQPPQSNYPDELTFLPASLLIEVLFRHSRVHTGLPMEDP